MSNGMADIFNHPIPGDWLPWAAVLFVGFACGLLTGWLVFA